MHTVYITLTVLQLYNFAIVRRPRASERARESERRTCEMDMNAYSVMYAGGVRGEGNITCVSEATDA